jgi:hypothetical protein
MKAPRLLNDKLPWFLSSHPSRANRIPTYHPHIGLYLKDWLPDSDYIKITNFINTSFLLNLILKSREFIKVFNSKRDLEDERKYCRFEKFRNKIRKRYYFKVSRGSPTLEMGRFTAFTVVHCITSKRKIQLKLINNWQKD